MKGTRPEQGLLTADNDLSRTDEAPRKRALFDKLRQQFDPSGKTASPKG